MYRDNWGTEKFMNYQDLEFEWDENKNKKNIQKHKIDFDTAAEVFDDYFHIVRRDNNHSENEDRYLAIGEIEGRLYLITVSFTERGNVIRIISARRANQAERREYYDR